MVKKGDTWWWYDESPLDYNAWSSSSCYDACCAAYVSSSKWNAKACSNIEPTVCERPLSSYTFNRTLYEHDQRLTQIISSHDEHHEFTLETMTKLVDLVKHGSNSTNSSINELLSLLLKLDFEIKTWRERLSEVRNGTDSIRTEFTDRLDSMSNLNHGHVFSWNEELEQVKGTIANERHSKINTNIRIREFVWILFLLIISLIVALIGIAIYFYRRLQSRTNSNNQLVDRVEFANIETNTNQV